MTRHHLHVRFERCGETFNAYALLTSESEYEEIVKSVYEQMRNVDSKPPDVDNGHGSATAAEDRFALKAAKFAADVFCMYTNSYEINGPRVRTNGHLDKRYTQWESRVPSLYRVSEKGTLVIKSSSGGRLYPDMEDDGCITAKMKRVDFFFGGETHSRNASLEVKMEPNVSPKVQSDKVQSQESQGADRRGKRRPSEPAAGKNKKRKRCSTKKRKKRMRIRLGTRVSVVWKTDDEDQSYEGTVVELHANGTVVVSYDDDDKCKPHDNFLSECKFEILPTQLKEVNCPMRVRRFSDQDKKWYMGLVVEKATDDMGTYLVKYDNGRCKNENLAEILWEPLGA